MKATPAEKRECLDILMRIMDDIPYDYADRVEAELEKQGLSRTRRQIYRAKGLESYDLDIMRAMEKISRPIQTKKKIKSVADYTDQLRRTGL